MSLKIEKKNEGTKDTVMLSGRLDTTTAPELDVFAEKELADTQELVLDFADPKEYALARSVFYVIEGSNEISYYVKRPVHDRTSMSVKDGSG